MPNAALTFRQRYTSLFIVIYSYQRGYVVIKRGNCNFPNGYTDIRGYDFFSTMGGKTRLLVSPNNNVLKAANRTLVWRTACAQHAEWLTHLMQVAT